MTNPQTDLEREEKTRGAVAFAMEGRWENAALANREITNLYPDDPGAWNRLGKALLELGKYGEASEAFSNTLNLQPRNPVAVKNLERLKKLGNTRPTAKAATKRAPQLFIDESGVTTLSSLRDVSQEGILLHISPGDVVRLETEGKKLFIRDNHGEHIGQIEARLASRIIRLQEGGNLYEAAIASIDEVGVTVVVRETYQDPSQLGVVSFPRKPDNLTGLRPGVSAIHDGAYDSDEDAALDDAQLPPMPAWTEDDGEGMADEDVDEDAGNLTIRAGIEEQGEIEEELDS